MVVALVVIGLGIVIGIYAFTSQSAQRPLDNSALPSLQAAQTSMPKSDVPGVDVTGLPRPTGSVRTYYLVSGTVTTLIYNAHTVLTDVRGELTQRLPIAGWTPVAGVPSQSGGSVSNTSLWSATYADQQRVLQISMFRNGDITSTTFVIQLQPTK